MENLIKEFSSGKPVIILNEIDNSGNIFLSGEFIQGHYIHEMFSYSSGIVYITMSEEKACSLSLKSSFNLVDHLKIPVISNITPITPIQNPIIMSSCLSTPIMSCLSTPINFKNPNLLTNEDKAKIITEMASNNSNSNKFIKDNNIFPLVCKNGLLKEKQGYIEASIQLCILSGLNHLAVVCDLTNKDKTPMSLNECSKLSKTYNIPLATISDIHQYSEQINFKNPLKSNLIYTESSIKIKDYKDSFKLRIYKNNYTNKEISILYRGILGNEIILRLQDESLVTNIFKSNEEEEEYKQSINIIYKRGGMIMYIKDNHNLYNKVEHYRLKSYGEDNNVLNNSKENYFTYIHILKELGIQYIELISKNQNQIDSLKEYFKVKCVDNNNDIKNKSEESLLFINKESKESDFNINKDISISNKTVNIIYTIFNKDINLSIANKIKYKLEEYNLKVIFYEVPRVYEIPFVCNKLMNNFNKQNIYITLGFTFNDTYNNIDNVLINLQLKYNTIIINGIINNISKISLDEEYFEHIVNSSLADDLCLSTLQMLQYDNCNNTRSFFDQH